MCSQLERLDIDLYHMLAFYSSYALVLTQFSLSLFADLAAVRPSDRRLRRDRAGAKSNGRNRTGAKTNGLGGRRPLENGSAVESADVTAYLSEHKASLIVEAFLLSFNFYLIYL